MQQIGAHRAIHSVFVPRPKALIYLARGLLLYAVSFTSLSLGQGRAELRLAHFSPDAPRLDLVLDGEIILRDVSFADVTAYLSVEAGEHELKVYPHRPPAASSDAVTPWGGDRKRDPIVPLTLNVDLVTGEQHTLVAAGFYDPLPTGSETGELLVETEADTTITVTGPGGFSNAGTGDLRLRNLVPGVYTVEAAREGAEGAEYTVDVLADISVTLPITLQTADGGAPEEPAEPAQAPRDVSWQRMQLQFFSDSKYEDSAPVAVAGGLAAVRVIHVSPVTPALDLVLTRNADERRPWQGVAFPDATSYAALPAGRYTVTMRAEATSSVLGELRNLPLETGLRYTLYVVGSVVDSYVALVPSVDGGK